MNPPPLRFLPRLRGDAKWKRRPLTWHERGQFEAAHQVRLNAKTETEVIEIYTALLAGGAESLEPPEMLTFASPVYLPWGFFRAMINLGEVCITILTPSFHGPWALPDDDHAKDAP